MTTATEQQSPAMKRAIAEINRFADKEIELVNKRIISSKNLAEAEQVAGLAYIEDRSPNLDHVLKLRAELSTIDGAIKSCQQMRLNAVKNKYRVDAEETRRKVAEKRDSLAELQKKTAKHLEALSALEGVAYSFDILGQQYDTRDIPARGVPKSERLENEIFQLERTAQELEKWQPLATGCMDLMEATSFDEPLKAALLFEGETPTAQQVLDWLNAVQAEAARRNVVIGAETRRIRLQWRDAKISFDESYVFIAGHKEFKALGWNPGQRLV